MTCSELQKLKSFSDDAWYYLILQRDPLYDKIKAGHVPEVLERAKVRGRQLAEKWIEENDDINLIQERLEYHGIKVSLLEREQKPPMIVFATFKVDPMGIDLYMPAIRHAREMLDVEGSWEDETVPEVESIKNLILAHEAFHYMDECVEEGRLVEKVEYKTGPFKRTATLRATDEVAAAVFAQIIVQPNYNPGLLDVALLTAYQTKKENYAAIFSKALQNINDQLIR